MTPGTLLFPGLFTGICCTGNNTGHYFTGVDTGIGWCEIVSVVLSAADSNEAIAGGNRSTSMTCCHL